MTPWFGREETLEALRKRIEGFLAGFRQNCALLGPEAIGKTTLLRRLLRQESKNSSLVGLYLEVREGESLAEWAQRLIQSLLYGVLRVRGIEELPASFNALLEKSHTDIPRTVSEARRLLSLAGETRNDEAYDRLWDLPHLMTQETGLPCFLILDEFDRLRHLPVKEPFHRLGRKIMVQSTTLYLVASSQVPLAREILREGLSLLFGQFEMIELGVLHPWDSLRAIRSVWPKGEANPFMEHLLIELSHGYPASLDLLIQGLMDRFIEGFPKDPERSLVDLLESLFLEQQGDLRIRFEEKLRSLPVSRNRRGWVETLSVVSGGVRRISDVADALDQTKAQVLRALRVLEQKGLVVQEGVFYRIPDSLFELWMFAAYPLLQGVDLVDPTQARAHFRDAAWGWMEKVKEAIHQPMENHVGALLARWGGELVEIERKRIRLPHFSQVEPKRGSSGWQTFLAHRSGATGKSWWVIPWKGPLQEAQARGLVQEMKGSPYRDFRRLLVGAHPVEINARLILQEARVKLWDLQTFNDVLSLYGFHRIPYAAEGFPPLQRQVGSIPREESDPRSSSLKDATTGQGVG